MQLAVLQFEQQRPQQTKMQLEKTGFYDSSKRLQAIRGEFDASTGTAMSRFSPVLTV